ncbi:MAG: outer membrane protein assembly factor BamA [Verrucomicrobia bacterium]|nr:outer membrane protein assembly factor BamA [Verrucomicrobiota bacterium]
MRKKVLFAVAISLIFAFSLIADTPPLEHSRVQKITVEVIGGGESNAQEVAIMSRLKTKEGVLFSQEDFDEDLKILSRDYDRIEPQIQALDGTLTVKLKIWLKPKIKTIIWHGNSAFSKEKLGEELGIKPGALFDRPLFNKAFHKLKNYYIKRGYFEAELDYHVTHDPSPNEVTITIDIKEGRAGIIDDFVIHNVTKKERDAILELMLTKSYSVFTSWLTQEGTYNPEVMRHDEMAILSYLQDQGYADAKVKITTVPAKKKDRIIVDIDVYKGELYHFAGISFEGNTVIPTEKLLSLLPIKEGGLYSPDKLRAAVKAIHDAYGTRGYIDAVITPESKPVAGEHAYTTRFHIQEGQPFRVGLIKVFGNNVTDISVILHEILLTPGGTFDSQMLAKSEERLRNIGYFKNVNIYAVKSSGSSSGKTHFRDVYVEVEENPTTANFSLFGAYSTTERASVGVGFTESNFNSMGIFSIFKKGLKAVRGGGENLNFSTTVGSKMLLYNLSWTKPYFLDTPWIVGFDATKMRNSYSANDYTVKAYSLQLFANYPINAFVKAGMQYRLRHSFITLKDVEHKRRNRQLIHESRNGGLISAAGPTLSYDSTDNPQFPRQGIRSSLSLEYAGLGGDHQFVKAMYLNNFYYAPYEYGLFRFRANAQFIRTLGGTHPRDLPLDERLYMGGEQSLRGYRFNTVGPHFHDTHHTPRGGITSLLFSGEYDQYVFKKLDAYVFIDVGNAYFRGIDLGTLRYTAGYGIKVKAFGNAPLVLGIGYPLNPQRHADVKRFFFSLGAAF